MSKARELSQRAGVDGALSNRNLIINGAMQVAQRGTSHTLASNNYGSLDRWNGSGFSGPTCTMEQSTVAPANFKNSLKFTVTTGASVDATDYSDVRQYIEGNNVSHLKWGTADAQDVTVSFWVRCSATGTFAVSICNSSYTRNYPATYVINSADTWEYKSVTISGDTSGTWLNDGGVGLRLVFDLGVGSTYSSTTGQWSSGVYFGGSGVTKLAATTGATWYITGVQLEVGDTATPFEHRSYGQELALCQRFFCTSGGPVVPQQHSYTADLFLEGIGAVYTDSFAYSNAISFPCPMRTSPTVTIVAPSLSSANNQAAIYSRNGGWNTCDATNPNAGPSGMMIDLRDNSGFVGRDSCLYFVGWYADAEL